MKPHGCYVALITPFLENGSVNESGLREHVEFLIEQGVDGLVPCGTTGESATLSWEEHNRIVAIVLDQAKKRVGVIAGAGSNNTSESIDAARHAKARGADGILCITPYYNKPTQEGLYQHYRMLATHVDIPLILYNVPGRTGVSLSPETIERLCEFPTIIGIKEASGSIETVTEIHRRCGDRLVILAGEDVLIFPILACGGKGTISASANVVPGLIGSLIRAFDEGDRQRALQFHEKLFPVAKALFLETNPIPVKTALTYLGFDAGPLRLPLVAMSEGNKQTLITVLKENNISLGR